MHSRNVLVFLGLACIASAVPTPLNINLGAYSPALVVGDGAIAFRGGGEGAAAAEGAVAAEGAGAAEGGGGGETAAPATEEATASALSTSAVR